ncbi:hypothetical protein CWO89_15905 [Bradyrhizobium sp. Leo170]|nr:hypothetical protein CWO89_15905 [Bradyrhizobium sp. Leo170]
MTVGTRYGAGGPASFAAAPGVSAVAMPVASEQATVRERDIIFPLVLLSGLGLRGKHDSSDLADT